MASWLWAQYNDFAFGVAIIVGLSALIGLARMLLNEPRETAAKLCGSIAWFFTLMAILWAAHLADKYL